MRLKPMKPFSNGNQVKSRTLQAHQILMTGLIDEVGQYRHGGVGVMSGDRVVHMAPPANQINRLMVDLLDWLNDSEVHPLIKVQYFTMSLSLFIHLRMAMGAWEGYGKL